MKQINHTNYYTDGGIEVANFIDAHGLNFNKGNVIKYVARAGKKQGEDEHTTILMAFQEPVYKSWHGTGISRSALKVRGTR